MDRGSNIGDGGSSIEDEGSSMKDRGKRIEDEGLGVEVWGSRFEVRGSGRPKNFSRILIRSFVLILSRKKIAIDKGLDTMLLF